MTTCAHEPQTMHPVDAEYLNQWVSTYVATGEFDAIDTIAAFSSKRNVVLPSFVQVPYIDKRFTLARLVTFTGTRFLSSALVQPASTAAAATDEPLFPPEEREAAGHMFAIMAGQAPKALSIAALGQLADICKFSMADCILSVLPEYIKPLIESADSDEAMALCAIFLRFSLQCVGDEMAPSVESLALLCARLERQMVSDNPLAVLFVEEVLKSLVAQALLYKAQKITLLAELSGGSSSVGVKRTIDGNAVGVASDAVQRMFLVCADDSSKGGTAQLMYAVLAAATCAGSCSGEACQCDTMTKAFCAAKAMQWSECGQDICSAISGAAIKVCETPICACVRSLLRAFMAASLHRERPFLCINANSFDALQELDYGRLPLELITSCDSVYGGSVLTNTWTQAQSARSSSFSLGHLGSLIIRPVPNRVHSWGKMHVVFSLPPGKKGHICVIPRRTGWQATVDTLLRQSVNTWSGYDSPAVKGFWLDGHDAEWSLKGEALGTVLVLLVAVL